MKHFTLSVAALAAMGTFALAGGDIEAPVEPAVEVEAPAAVSDSGFYIGGAYSFVNSEMDYHADEYHYDELYYQWGGTYDRDYDAFMLQAGYQFNQYVAIEGRYWNSITERSQDSWYRYVGQETQDNGEWSDGDFEAWGIYVKPMYPVTEALDIYALLGYGNVESDDQYWGDTALDENGFQWGLGASYGITENVSLFLDYVQLCNGVDDSHTQDSGDWDYVYNWEHSIYTVNLGLTYKF